MISCKEASAMFERYLDRELNAKDIEVLEDHIHKCKGCFGHMEFDKAMKKLVQKKSIEVSLSSSIKDLIRSKLK